MEKMQRMNCIKCCSFAINIDSLQHGGNGDYCDICYWQIKYEALQCCGNCYKLFIRKELVDGYVRAQGACVKKISPDKCCDEWENDNNTKEERLPTLNGKE